MKQNYNYQRMLTAIVFTALTITSATWANAPAKSSVPPAEKKIARYGNTVISGYNKFSLDAKKNTFVFTYQGKGTELTSAAPEYNIKLKAQSIKGEVGPETPNESKKLTVKWVKADIGVNADIVQKDKNGNIIQNIKVSADHMSFDINLNKITLEGNITIDTDALTQTGNKGTVIINDDGGYQLDFEGGQTIIKPIEE